MVARFRSWWQTIKQHPVATVMIALLVVVHVLVVYGGYKFNWDWTGFNRPSKTLWDWLQLLGVLAVPIVVGFGAVWFTSQQSKVAEAENKDNQRESALQAYIDKISELLLHENLRESKPGTEIRDIARARTLALLQRLDAGRKGSVLKFLYETGLIKGDNCVIDLSDADLSHANIYLELLLGRTLNTYDLSGINLRDAHLEEACLPATKLSGANLSGAMLHDANLAFVDLRGANLQKSVLFGTELNGAKLDGAILDGAKFSSKTNVTQEQLNTAKSLQDAFMPDRSKHP